MSGKYSEIHTIEDKHFGVSKGFKKHSNPKYPQHKSMKIIPVTFKNVRYLDKCSICTVDYSDNDHVLIDYNETFAQYLVFTNGNVLIDKVYCSVSKCTLAGYMVNKILIITDIYKYDSIDLSQMNYIDRYQYIKKITLTGINYELIELIPSNQIVDYIKYSPTISTNGIRSINFYVTDTRDNVEKIYRYDIDIYDYLLPKSVLTWKFLLQKTSDNCKDNFPYQLMIKCMNGEIRHYQYLHCKNITTVNAMYINDQSIVECYINKYGCWIPVASTTTLDTVPFQF